MYVYAYISTFPPIPVSQVISYICNIVRFLSYILHFILGFPDLLNVFYLICIRYGALFYYKVLWASANV